MERWDDSVSHQESFQNLTSLIQWAEAGARPCGSGNTTHRIHRRSNPLTQLAYLAGKTTTIRLGAGTLIAPSGIRSVPQGMRAVLMISNGRMEVGLHAVRNNLPDRLTPGLSAADGGSYLRELRQR